MTTTPIVPLRKGAMFIIEAPSGTGKGTICRELLRRDNNLKFSISATTRDKRPGEQDVVDYYFITDEQYNNYVAQDAFYEYVDSQYGNRYGTLKSEVDTYINAGIDVLFDMDWDGARQMRSRAPEDVVTIYILPPSIKELRRRLETRGTDTPEIINKRMGLIVDKIKHWNEFDYVIINDNLETSVQKIQAIFASERMKRTRQLGLKRFVKELIKEAQND